MCNLFTVKHSKYSLRSGVNLEVPHFKTSFGINTFDFRATMAFNNLPRNIKSQSSVNLFKLAVKRIFPACACKICS